MTMKVRVLWAAVLLVGTMCLAGCGHYTCSTTFGASSCGSSGGGLSQGGGTSLTQTALVYFVGDKTGGLAAEGINLANSQTFAPVANFVSPVVPQTTDYGVVIVGKKYLYILFSNNSLYGFSIDAGTAALTAVPNSPYSVTGISIASEPTGQFLFVGDASGVTMYTVNANDGSLTAIVGSPFSTGGLAPIQMATDGMGKYLYGVTGAEILAFSYGTTGMTAVPGSPFSASNNAQFAVVQVAGDKSGKFLMGTTAEIGTSGVADNSIYVFSIVAGALVPVSGSPFPTTNAPAYIAVSPANEDVYAFTETYVSPGITLDPIEGYSLDTTTGILAPLALSPFTTILSSNGIFDQSGQYLIAIGQETNATAAGTLPLTVDLTTGALTSSIAHLGAVSNSFAVTDEP